MYYRYRDIVWMAQIKPCCPNQFWSNSKSGQPLRRKEGNVIATTVFVAIRGQIPTWIGLHFPSVPSLAFTSPPVPKLHPSPTSESPDTATILPSQHLTTARSTRGRLVASASERRSAANPRENYRAPGKHTNRSKPGLALWETHGKTQCFQHRSWVGHKYGTIPFRNLELNGKPTLKPNHPTCPYISKKRKA